MAKYNVTVTCTWECDGDFENKEEVIRLATAQFGVMLREPPPGLDLRTTIKADKLKSVQHNIVLGYFKPDEVLPYISRGKDKRKYIVDSAGQPQGGEARAPKEYMVRMNSQRYFVFKANPKCVCCGLEGTKMALEQHPGHISPHFNLYGVDDGKLVLMTKDHIHAKAFGGEDRYSNYQTMCAVCNNLKAAANLTLEGLQQLRKIYDDNKKIVSRKKLAIMIDENRKKLAMPRGKNHVRLSRFNRSHFLAKRKADEKTVIPNVDLNIWQQTDGRLLGRSVYENFHEDEVLFACIRQGMPQEVSGVHNGKIGIRLGELAALVYQGYLDFVGDEPPVLAEVA